MNTREPDFRLCVVSYHAPAPSLFCLQRLTALSENVPVKFGIVDGGTVTFSSFGFLQNNNVAHHVTGSSKKKGT